MQINSIWLVILLPINHKDVLYNMLPSGQTLTLLSIKKKKLYRGYEHSKLSTEDEPHILELKDHSELACYS